MERYYLWHYAKLKDLNGRSGEFYNNDKPKCGVYVIYSGNEAVYVGSGEVIKRLQDHQDRNDFKKYLNLMVAYAFVSECYRNVETFLAYMFRPAIGERYPDVDLIDINLPEHIRPKEVISTDKNIEELKRVAFLKSNLELKKRIK